MRRVVVLVVAAALVTGCSGSGTDAPSADRPPADRPSASPSGPAPSADDLPGLPEVPSRRAGRLADELDQAAGTVRRAGAADEVRAAAEFYQVAVRALARRPEGFRQRVVALLDRPTARAAREDLRAALLLGVLTTPGSRLPAWRIVEPPPAARLMRLYRGAQRQTGVHWSYLAAIHLVETRMGRIRGTSSAGAQGPMQFIPATWARFGRGGDVTDPRDAIPAAARLLRHYGGPRDMSEALWHYNPHASYVGAVTAYARNMRRHASAYDGYWSWRVFYVLERGTQVLPEGYPQVPAVPLPGEAVRGAGWTPPRWLGRRPLPVGDDGYGEVRPTPPALRLRRWNTKDTIAPLPGTGFASRVTAPAPARVLARSTWRASCPVGRSQLAWVRVTFRGFDGGRHTGELLVRRSAAQDLVRVFRRLWDVDFPLESLGIARRRDLRARPTGDGNGTGSFVCRPVTGGGAFSQHAYGLAIDVNPFQNPYAKGDLVVPELASSYLRRGRVRPGMITPRGPVVRAFAAIGWEWGGAWRGLKDYQHFSRNGR